MFILHSLTYFFRVTELEEAVAAQGRSPKSRRKAAAGFKFPVSLPSTIRFCTHKLGSSLAHLSEVLSNREIPVHCLQKQRNKLAKVLKYSRLLLSVCLFAKLGRLVV